MSDLLPIQRDRLREIGAQLKEAREQKQLSLDDVSAKTLIRATILRAIEEGDTRPLPEPVYIKGFIRRFGDLVGLGGQELSESFPWQPAQSVPAGFVTSGSIVAVTPQKTLAPVPPVTQAPAQPAVQPAATTSLVDQVSAKAGEAISAEADIAEARLEPSVSREGDAAALDVAPTDVADATELKPETDVPEVDVPETDGGLQPEVTRPNVDAAYASRAALFDDAIAPTPTASASAADSVARMDGSARDGSEMPDHRAEPEVRAAAQPLAPAAAVATLPPPPAPVSYQAPEERRMLPVILGLLGLGLGIGVAAIALSNRGPQGQIAQPPAETAPVETAAPAAAPVEPATSAVPAGQVVLDLEVRNEDAWVIVAVDGVDQIEGLQTVGFQQRWEGDEQIQLWTPRPDLVWISVNGSPQQPFGQMAEVSGANPIKTASFKPEGGE